MKRSAAWCRLFDMSIMQFEPLESRLFLSVALRDGVLILTGTNQNDVIEVYHPAILRQGSPVGDTDRSVTIVRYPTLGMSITGELDPPDFPVPPDIERQEGYLNYRCV